MEAVLRDYCYLFSSLQSVKFPIRLKHSVLHLRRKRKGRREKLRLPLSHSHMCTHCSCADICVRGGAGRTLWIGQWKQTLATKMLVTWWYLFLAARSIAEKCKYCYCLCAADCVFKVNSAEEQFTSFLGMSPFILLNAEAVKYLHRY